MIKVAVFFSVFGGAQPHWKFMNSYIKSVRNFYQFEGGENYEFAEKFCTVRHLEASRNAIVGMAREGFSHQGSLFRPHITLWFDLDLIIPESTIFSLVKSDKNVITGIYYTKRSAIPVISNEDKEGYLLTFTKYPFDIDFEVDFGAIGCMRIDVDVLKTLDAPYFSWQSLDKTKNYPEKDFYMRHHCKLMSEEVIFFKQIREKGHKVYVNPNLQCIHIGEKETGLREYVNRYGD